MDVPCRAGQPPLPRHSSQQQTRHRHSPPVTCLWLSAACGCRAGCRVRHSAAGGAGTQSQKQPTSFQCRLAAVNAAVAWAITSTDRPFQAAVVGWHLQGAVVGWHVQGTVSSGGTSKAPSSGGTSKALSSGGTSKAPSSGGTSKAPSSGGTSKAPLSGGTSKAPLSGGTSKAPSSGGNGASLDCHLPLNGPRCWKKRAGRLFFELGGFEKDIVLVGKAEGTFVSFFFDEAVLMRFVMGQKGGPHGAR